MIAFVVSNQLLMRDAIARLIYRRQQKANVVQLDQLAAADEAEPQHGEPSLISNQHVLAPGSIFTN